MTVILNPDGSQLQVGDWAEYFTDGGVRYGRIEMQFSDQSVGIEGEPRVIDASLIKSIKREEPMIIHNPTIDQIAVGDTVATFDPTPSVGRVIRIVGNEMQAYGEYEFCCPIDQVMYVKKPVVVGEKIAVHQGQVVEPSEPDIINHPPHYTSHPSGIECIQVTEHHNFCIGCAMKYLWRAGLKDGTPSVQDLKKAVWYINREIERISK